MKKPYIIRDYCLIRKNFVAVKDFIFYSSAHTDFTGFANSLYNKLEISYPKFHKMDNLCKLGFLSAEVLLRDKMINHKYSGEEVGIIFMNSSSSINTDRSYNNTISNREDYFPSPSIFVYTLPNVVIGEICIRHKFYGEGNFFVTKKINYPFLLNYVNQLFDSEIIQCCIVGWVDFDGDDFDSTILLVEKPERTDDENANFELSTIQSIYEKMK
jgi:hypothetical protein